MARLPNGLCGQEGGIAGGGEAPGRRPWRGKEEGWRRRERLWGSRGKGARVWAVAGAGVGRGDDGLAGERRVRIGENLLHAGAANPANERARRAHLSLASKNDCEVKIV